MVVMGSVIIGIWVGAFMVSYVFGMIEQRLNDAVENEVSHFQIHHPLFDRDYQAQYYIKEGASLKEEIAQDSRIRAVTARCVTFGMIASAQNSTGGKIIGIIPDSENQVTALDSKLTQGSYFEQGSKNKAIISERLAEKLKVKIRSKIVLTFQDTTGRIVAGAIRIIGHYKTYNTSYYDTHIFLTAPDLWNLL